MPTHPRGTKRRAQRERHDAIAEREAWCHASVGGASIDASGDRDTYIAARLVVDATPRPYDEVPRSAQAAVELNAARTDQALNGRVPAAGALDGQTRNVVRARAQRTVDQTRRRRIATFARRRRQLGIERAQAARRLDRRQPGHGPTSAAPNGPLVVAFHRNARVWIGRRLVAPRWTWRSSWRRAVAGGC